MDYLPAKANGFTFIEVLVGTALLVLFFAAASLIFQFSLEIVGGSRVRVVATNLAEEKIETVRNLSYVDVGTIGGIPSGTIPETEVVTINGTDFTIYTTVVYVDDPFDGLGENDDINTDYKRVQIQVTWDGLFESTTGVVLSTDASPNGLESDEGGGILKVYVINASGEPVAGAQVNIVNNVVSPPINLSQNTSGSGEILLPGSPACSVCYEISVSKNNYTSDRTYSSSEVANPLKPHVTVIEGDTSEITLKIDQESSIKFYIRGSRENNFPPFTGVQFRLKGTKTIGTDTSDQPVLKYDETLVSGLGGALTVLGLEWDTYEISIEEPSSVDFAGSYLLSPLSLIPGASPSVYIVTKAATPHNLLMKILDSSNQPVATASATIVRQSNGNIATRSAGLATDYDRGQLLFSGLSEDEYSITVNHPDYQEATASASISGDTVVELLLEDKL